MFSRAIRMHEEPEQRPRLAQLRCCRLPRLSGSQGFKIKILFVP
jgi:hypothetical protein